MEITTKKELEKRIIELEAQLEEAHYALCCILHNRELEHEASRQREIRLRCEMQELENQNNYGTMRRG